MRGLLTEPWLWTPLGLAFIVNLGLALLLGGIFARRYFWGAQSEAAQFHFVWPALGLALLLLGTLGEVAHNLWLFGFLNAPELGRYMLEETAGRSLLLGLIGALVLLAGEAGRWKWPPLLLPALLLLYGVGVQSHAVMNGAPTIAAQMVHLAAMSVWVGGVAALALGPKQTLQQAERMTTPALLSLTGLALTGWYAAAINGGDLATLRAADYGWVLAQKLWLLILALVAAARVRTCMSAGLGLRRALRLELALLLLVLLLSSWLGCTEPSSHLHV